MRLGPSFSILKPAPHFNIQCYNENSPFSQTFVYPLHVLTNIENITSQCFLPFSFLKFSNVRSKNNGFQSFRTCMCVWFSHKLRNETKNKKHKSPGGKLVLKGVSEAQIIGTLLLVDGVCPLAQELTGRGWAFRMFTSKSRRWRK